jgi:hypothetical protein
MFSSFVIVYTPYAFYVAITVPSCIKKEKIYHTIFYFLIIQTDTKYRPIFQFALLYSFYLTAGSGHDKVGSFLRSTIKSASKWAFLTHFFILFFIDDYQQKSVYYIKEVVLISYLIIKS